MSTLQAPRETPVAGAARLVGTDSRLVLLGPERPMGIKDEQARGYLGTAPLVDLDSLIAELETAGLRGRGGAGFPAYIKWAAVAAQIGPKVVVGNGHEGEPASSKDQWLVIHRPHLVLDGLLLAASVVGADRAVLYVSHPATIAAAERAVAELRQAGGVPVGVQLEVFRASGGYVAGEETAVCRAISGGVALPVAKPPRPSEPGGGVGGLPTLVNNVETLAHAAWIRRHGAEAFRATGTESSPGTALFTVTGACADGGVFEAPLGTTVGTLIEAAGGVSGGLSGVLMGGWFGGFLRGDRSDLSCCYQAVAATGSGLGCAAITTFAPEDSLLELAADLGSWFENESARQCGVCRNGTRAIHQTLRKVADGDGDPEHRENLARWGSSLSKRGACAFLDGAATLARSVAEELLMFDEIPLKTRESPVTDGDDR